MAAKGAHLSQTSQPKPSIFDFIAHETLNELLYPCARKIADFLSHRNASLLSVTKWFDEYFLLGHSFLQLYYLKKYGATFSEKFYGLQRIPIETSKTNLGNKELFLSLFAVSLFPYLKSKLDKIADELYFDHLPRTSQKEKIIFMKSVIYCNSGLNIFHQLCKFVQHLRFLSGHSNINSPLLWVAGVKLKYAEENPVDDWTFRNFLPLLLQRSLELSAFFIQFFQWWQTERGSNFTVVPVPPPPQISQNGMKYSNMCPICLKKREVDTALSTSGFVFCFKCITSYVMEHNRCPVTKLPTTVNSLIRIYPPS